MLEEDSDENYREVLDGVVNIHIELYEDRHYDLVGRRIRFSEDYRPVDIVLANFGKGNVQLKYVDTQDEASKLRREARDEFAAILDESEWDVLPSATRRSSNSEELYDKRLTGNIYARNARSSADEFLRRFTEFDSSEFNDLEVLE
jgi:succinate dehydrogenase flavin-adding protein (antitoxin of CptAB toxin-antitoxin module)